MKVILAAAPASGLTEFAWCRNLRAFQTYFSEPGRGEGFQWFITTFVSFHVGNVLDGLLAMSVFMTKLPSCVLLLPALPVWKLHMLFVISKDHVGMLTLVIPRVGASEIPEHR